MPEVANRLGLELVAAGADRSFACPACGKERRHSKDASKRRAAKVTPDGGGWWCEPCGAKGDAVALAAALVTGAVKPETPEGWREVRRECAALGLCEADPGDPQAPTARRYEPPARPVVTETKPARLPAAEVAALWAVCPRLDAVPSWEITDDTPTHTGPGDEERDAVAPDGPPGWCGEARRYLVARGLNVGHLAAVDAVRVVPPAAVLEHWPSWWPSTWGRSWRLAVPLYDASGAMVALQARSIDKTDDPKTRNPKGAGVTSGAFFASTEGLALLRGAYTGPGLVLVEGLTDTLAAVDLVARLEPHQRPAVLGLVAGSAKGLATLNVLASKRVNVMTDNDSTGEKYFREVMAAAPTLNGWRLPLKPIGSASRSDLNDWLRHDARKAITALTYDMKGAT